MKRVDFVLPQDGIAISARINSDTMFAMLLTGRWGMKV